MIHFDAYKNEKFLEKVLKPLSKLAVLNDPNFTGLFNPVSREIVGAISFNRKNDICEVQEIYGQHKSLLCLLLLTRNPAGVIANSDPVWKEILDAPICMMDQGTIQLPIHLSGIHEAECRANFSLGPAGNMMEFSEKKSQLTNAFIEYMEKETKVPQISEILDPLIRRYKP
jgi:hypothetical protein